MGGVRSQHGESFSVVLRFIFWDKVPKDSPIQLEKVSIKPEEFSCLCLPSDVWISLRCWESHSGPPAGTASTLLPWLMCPNFSFKDPLKRFMRVEWLSQGLTPGKEVEIWMQTEESSNEEAWFTVFVSYTANLYGVTTWNKTAEGVSCQVVQVSPSTPRVETGASILGRCTTVWQTMGSRTKRGRGHFPGHTIKSDLIPLRNSELWWQLRIS